MKDETFYKWIFGVFFAIGIMLIAFGISIVMSILSAFQSINEFQQNDETVEITETVPHENVNQVKNSHYNVTPEERDLLARIVTCEASICSLECQKDVCSVIFNRLESGKWKKDMNNDGEITLYDIIYYPNAFSPTIDGALDRCTEPCKSAYKAVDYVIENGPTVPTYVRYFRASYDFFWDGYENYKTIDNVYFGYFEDWQKGAW